MARQAWRARATLGLQAGTPAREFSAPTIAENSTPNDIRYLRHSFFVPLASRLGQEGLGVDAETANVAVRRWLREVANNRLHGTTGEIPAERLVLEQPFLQPVPAPYGGQRIDRRAKAPLTPVVGLQHPLSFYDAFAGAIG